MKVNIYPHSMTHKHTFTQISLLFMKRSVICQINQHIGGNRKSCPTNSVIMHINELPVYHMREDQLNHVHAVCIYIYICVCVRVCV